MTDFNGLPSRMYEKNRRFLSYAKEPIIFYVLNTLLDHRSKLSYNKLVCDPFNVLLPYRQGFTYYKMYI